MFKDARSLFALGVIAVMGLAVACSSTGAAQPEATPSRDDPSAATTPTPDVTPAPTPSNDPIQFLLKDSYVLGRLRQ